VLQRYEYKREEQVRRPVFLSDGWGDLWTFEREASGAGGICQEELFGVVCLQDGDLSDYARILC
jgi:hypothetical protein